MGYNAANFPASVWDGTSKNRDSRNEDSTPGIDDWSQITAEVVAIQDQFRQSAITDLTDNSGGTADSTVEAMPAAQATPSGATAAELTAINNNFAELSAKLDSVLTALRNANIIVT